MLEQIRVQVTSRGVLQHHISRVAVSEGGDQARDARVAEQLQHRHLADHRGAVRHGRDLRSLDDLHRIFGPRRLGFVLIYKIKYEIKEK